MVPPRGAAPAAMRQRLSRSLTTFFGASRRWRVPSQRRSIVDEEASRHILGVSGVDRCAERARGAEGEPAELQSGGGRDRALLDEVHRDRAHLRVLFAVEHFEAVDDRPDRADHIVADARA